MPASSAPLRPSRALASAQSASLCLPQPHKDPLPVSTENGCDSQLHVGGKVNQAPEGGDVLASVEPAPAGWPVIFERDVFGNEGFERVSVPSVIGPR